MAIEEFLSSTYATYEAASGRTYDSQRSCLSSHPPINLYNGTTLPRLLLAATLILLHSFYPFIFVILSWLFIAFNEYASVLTPVGLLLLLVIWRTQSKKHSKPGLYFSSNERNLAIIQQCPLLQSELNHPGSVTRQFNFCPWMFSGDLRTLFPYLANKPSAQSYHRRWIRVPLAAGPLERMKNADEGGQFEAVAVDYVLQETSSKNLMILAGLSGGSNEGYCLDLVEYASRRGWNCFVMLGRGLADPNLPCLSDALFHGARLSDAAATAKLITNTFRGDLMMAGISLGGIIVANGLSRNVFGDDVQAGVAISGCCDNAGNISFQHSREVWQPILAHGLKQVFATHPILLSKMHRALGPRYREIMLNIKDIVEFDSTVVTAVNGFDDVFHYYSELSPVMDSRRIELRKPLLMLHAMDDPIIHVDHIPSTALRCTPTSSSLSENMVTLITAVGGHVGWPLGWFPWNNRWEFQNRITLEFLESNCNFLDKNWR